MHQTAPYPDDLADLVSRAHGFDGWTFHLEDGTWDEGTVKGLRLIITIRHQNSYDHDEWRRTQFHYQVPITRWVRADWQRWIFDRCMDVWRHETGENLSFEYERPTWDADGEAETRRVRERPFAPFHGPGRDPNRNVEVGIDPAEQRIAQEYLPYERYPGLWWDGYIVHDDETHDRDCRGQSFGPPKCIPVHLAPGEER